MVRVAIAGGTGGIGRHIVEAILATKKHTVVVLSRSSSNATVEAWGAQVITVDFTEHASLVAALQGVHTIISAIWSHDTLATSQIALLNASVEAGVKRFAPSEWAVAAMPNEPIAAYRPKAEVADAVAKSGLEWTIYENGMFMNYFASSTKGIGYLKPLKFVVDVENGTARVPGTGDQKVTHTSAEDIGAFVAASLDLKTWPRRSGMVGETISHNEVIRIAEKLRGRKFEVTYVSEEELRKSLDPNPPTPWKNFSSEVFLQMLGGRLVCEASLNTLCPQVKPMGVEEFMTKWWSN
ncbi:NAD-P-binding protein [Ramaria rubella]|nr:NAD-P-binding protein [Ramaria rubella]